MVGMDGAEHAAARRAVMSEFTNSRIKDLRPHIQEIVDHFVDEMFASDQPVDLVAALAVPVPALVNCELLGVPFSDRNFFYQRSAMLTSPAIAEEEREVVSRELMVYLGDLVAAKEKEPTDDLLGRQIMQQREQGLEDRRGLVSLAFLLLVSGYETTASMISLGMLALLESPEQLAAIRSDPAKTPLAVEELLRYCTPVEHITCRVADADIEIDGVVIRAGDGVIISGPAANRDARVFADPNRLDILRDARPHLAFGYGPHHCIGQNLARAELQIVYDTLIRRMPRMRLAVRFEHLRFKLNANFYSVYEMPVRW
jgi:cytochrome P450